MCDLDERRGLDVGTNTPVMKPSMGFCVHRIRNLYNSDPCPLNIAAIEL